MRPCETEWQRKWIGLEVTHPDIQGLASECERFIAKLCASGPNVMRGFPLVIAGGTGCGKTHVARRMFKFVDMAGFNLCLANKLDHPVSTGFYHWPKLADSFKDFEMGSLDDIFEADFAVLDDIGAESDTRNSMVTDKLCQVLSRREKKFTVVTTNIEPSRWRARFDDRIDDRLMRGTKIVDLFAVPSYSLLQ
jgi:DNA replication protein DnaC